MSAKDDMLKAIKKKADKNRELKDRSRGIVKPGRLVADFIEAVERARLECEIGIDFSQQVDRAFNVMMHRLHRVDPCAEAEVVWHREEHAEKWTDLRPTGVKITWSDFWKKENPDKEGEVFIGADQLWLLDDL